MKGVKVRGCFLTVPTAHLLGLECLRWSHVRGVELPGPGGNIYFTFCLMCLWVFAWITGMCFAGLW